MFNTKKEYINCIIKWFARCVVLINTLLGIFWLFNNLGVYISDSFSDDYIQAANSLIVDDYLGILYALVVRVFGSGVFLQLFQLISFGIALAVLVNRICEKCSLFDKLTIICGVFFSPFLLQIQCCALPNSLVLSMFLFLLVTTRDYLYRDNYLLLFLGFAELIIIGLLDPVYIWIGPVILLALYLLILRKNKRKLHFLGVVAVATLAVGIFISSSIAEPKTYGRVTKSFEFLMFQRAIWPHSLDLSNEGERIFEEQYDDYIDTLKESSQNSALLVENIGSMFEEKLEDNADKFFASIFKTEMDWGKKRIIIPILKDVLCYLFPTFSIFIEYASKQLGNISSQNLACFFEQNSLSSRCFFVFYVFSYLFLYLLTVLVDLFSGKSTFVLKKIGMILLISVPFALANMFCYFRGFDYRLSGWNFTVFSIFIYIWILDKESV